MPFLCEERRVATGSVKWQVESLCEFSDKSCIGISFRPADSVMEVNHREHDAQLSAQFQKRAKQCNRIRATGHSHTYPVARTKQVTRSDIAEQVL